MFDLTTSQTDPAGKYALPTLEQLARIPAWHADAACKEHPDLTGSPSVGTMCEP